MQLKPQDILFLLKLISIGDIPWSFNKLAIDLGMSPSEVHAASNRALAAGLAIRKKGKVHPNIRNLEEFLLHGLKYVFVAERGKISWGMLTCHGAPPLDVLVQADNELSLVWPDPEGDVRGESFSPLYQSVPGAAKKDPKLYELLVLVDAIRSGRTREREEAIKELKLRLSRESGSMCGQIKNDEDKLAVGNHLTVSRSALNSLVRRHHIKRLTLFGSMARGDVNADSDVDLLVEFESGKSPSLGGMVKIKHDFVAFFGGRDVDIATPSILNNPYRKRAIERDMEELYAA